MIEIERKFLVNDQSWKAGVASSVRYADALVASSPFGKVRIRRAPDTAWITVKGERRGFSRSEFEYEIPLADADAMLAELCDGSLVEKTRHFVPVGRHTWEVDVFHGKLSGLVVAEIELSHPDESFDLPPWIGEEITGDPRFGSGALLKAAASGAPLPSSPPVNGGTLGPGGRPPGQWTGSEPPGAGRCVPL